MSFELFSLENIQEIARQYGYGAVFTGILLENTGIPIPGETITLVGGFLAGSGELNYWLVLGCAMMGAVVGDNFGYWIGRIGGWSFLVRFGKFFGFQESILETTKTRFAQNAPQAVFLGRFIAFLRIFAGPLAGIARMPYWQFLLCNFAGAALWAFTIVNIAFFLGKLIPLPQLVEWLARFGIFTFFLVIILLIVNIWREKRNKTIENERL